MKHGGKQMHFNYVWLRDHCRTSFASTTVKQRVVDTAAIDLAIRPISASVQDGSLTVTCKLIFYALFPIYNTNYMGDTVAPRARRCKVHCHCVISCCIQNSRTLEITHLNVRVATAFL